MAPAADKTSTRTLAIVEFLTARLDEDERHAGGTGVVGWLTYRKPDGSMLYTTAASRCDDGTWVINGKESGPLASAEVCYDEARVLADVAAKRETVRLLDEYDYLDPTPYDDGKPLSTAVLIARQMAAVYSDHPDYQPGWRV